MPGRLFLETPLRVLADRASAAGLPGSWVEGERAEDDPPRRNIQPGQQVAVLTAEGWRRMRWGIVPVGRVNARGRPVMETIINARSETVFSKTAFDGVGRAAMPADGWYEWTGQTRRKTAWRLASGDGAPLWFAAITDAWAPPGGGTKLWQVAAVTCEPSKQVAEIHHRMGVLLREPDLPTWISGSEEEAAALARPWPEGALSIEEARDVDWSAA